MPPTTPTKASRRQPQPKHQTALLKASQTTHNGRGEPQQCNNEGACGKLCNFHKNKTIGLSIASSCGATCKHSLVRYNVVKLRVGDHAVNVAEGLREALNDDEEAKSGGHAVNDRDAAKRLCNEIAGAMEMLQGEVRFWRCISQGGCDEAAPS